MTGVPPWKPSSNSGWQVMHISSWRPWRWSWQGDLLGLIEKLTGRTHWDFFTVYKWSINRVQMVYTLFILGLYIYIKAGRMKRLCSPTGSRYLVSYVIHSEFFKALSLDNNRYQSWHTKHHWNDLVDGVSTPAIKVMISKIWVCSNMGSLRIAKTS